VEERLDFAAAEVDLEAEAREVKVGEVDSRTYNTVDLHAERIF